MGKFVTRDLPRAAFVMCEGFDLVNVTRSGRTVVFHFQSDVFSEDGVRQLLLDYDNKKTSVEPVEYHRNYDQLKNKVYEVRS